MIAEKRYAFNFDLDTSKLKQYYPNPNWRKAYDDLHIFFKERNFSHRQGSGYLSDNLLNDADIVKISKELGQKFSWLSQCVKKFDVTEVGLTHDIVNIIKEQSDLVRKFKKIYNNNSPHKLSLNEQLNKAEQKKNEINSQKDKSVHKNKDNLTL